MSLELPFCEAEKEEEYVAADSDLSSEADVDILVEKEE